MTEEQIQQIEQMAELQFTDRELQLICSLSKKEVETVEVMTAIATGRLRAEAAVRQSIKLMAEQGSSSAQKQFIALIEKRKEEDE